MNRVIGIDIKNRMHFFFDYIINIKNFDPNNIKVDQKSYKNILIYYVGYVTQKGVKTLHFIINNANRYTEESNGCKQN